MSATGITFLGFKAFQHKMNGIGKNLHRAMQAGNKAAVAVADKEIKENFETEGKVATSGGWKKLAPSTIAGKIRDGKYPSQILQDNGWLKNKWKLKATPKEAEVRSQVDYGIYHDQRDEKGKKLPAKKMPWRPIIPDKKLWIEKAMRAYHIVFKKVMGI